MKEIKSLNLVGHINPITCLKFNKEGDLIVASSKDKLVTVWRSSNGEILGSFKHKGSVNWCSINYDSTRIITSVASYSVDIWDVNSGDLVSRVGFSGPVKVAEFALGGKTIFAITDKASRKPPTIHVIDLPKEVFNKSGKSVDGETIKAKLKIPVNSKITCAIWGSLNKTIIVGCEDGSIRVFNAKNGKSMGSVTEHKNSVHRLGLSKNGMMFISSSADNTAKLWETKTLEVIKTYQSSEPVNCAAISPLKNHIILAGGPSSMDVTTMKARNSYFNVRFFHKVFEEEIGSLKGHFGPIHAVSFSPSGRSFCSGGEDGYLKLVHFGENYFEGDDGINFK